MRKKTNNSFKIPDNYFEDFKQRIPKIISDNKKEIKPRSNKLSIYYAVAASIILLIVSAITFLPILNEQKNSPIQYELSDAEYYDIEMDDLYFAYNEEVIPEEVSAVEDEDMVNYLADEMDLDEILLLSNE